MAAQSVRHLQALQQPFFRPFEGQGAQWADMNRFRRVHDPVQNNEKITPRNQPCAVPVKPQRGVGATADEEFIDTLLGGSS